MKLLGALLILVAIYVAILFPFSQHMKQRPFLEKVGYVPQPFIMKTIAADQKNLLAAGLIAKVLIYYGTLVEKDRISGQLPPDHDIMHATLIAASRLDPYNMDTYYFSQAMAWDFKKVEETTALLEYGMEYRDWDFYLPFFAGFDYSFFLHDYPAAATHYATAARLSGSDLFGRLASRYMHEAGQTELAINYLGAMVESSRNEAIKKSFSMRHTALVEVRRIEIARDNYRQQYGRLPNSLVDLYSAGLLIEAVTDPYGGQFYLEPNGSVRSTSKFAAVSEKKKN